MMHEYAMMNLIKVDCITALKAYAQKKCKNVSCNASDTNKHVQIEDASMYSYEKDATNRYIKYTYVDTYVLHPSAKTLPR